MASEVNERARLSRAELARYPGIYEKQRSLGQYSPRERYNSWDIYRE
jgi:hypothetical protein